MSASAPALALALLLLACSSGQPGAAADGGPSADGGPACGKAAAAQVAVAPEPEPLAANTLTGLTTTRLFPTAASPGTTFAACHLASPVWREAAAEVLAVAGDRVTALDPESGSVRWSVELPAPDGEMAFVVGTPALVEPYLVVAYHTTDRTASARSVLTPRHRHLVAVVDLVLREVSAGFPTLELQGEVPAPAGGGSVPFRPTNALGRAEVVRGLLPGDVLGRVYVTFGNAIDLQPWHGFAFEIDLDAWKSGCAPVTGFLVTTPEAACGTPGQSGSRDRVCGGGLWAPSGPLVHQRADGFELILAPGNGQLDLSRGDYANTLMRVAPGLAFDPGCVASSCEPFDPNEPSRACVESCADLFVPRMPAAGEPYPRPSYGLCDGLTMFQCWERLDYIGGSTPALLRGPSGEQLLLYPTKDGAVYLVDAAHLGTMYDRLQLVPICGTPTSACQMDWAGMIVTQPVVTRVAGKTLAIVPTFMPDGEQPAGVVAVSVEEGPRLVRAWEFPRFDSADATRRFRGHPSRPTLQRFADGEALWVVDVIRSGRGSLIAMRTSDGALLAEQQLAGPGYRFTRPLVAGDRLFVPSCASDEGPSFLEGYRVTPP